MGRLGWIIVVFLFECSAFSAGSDKDRDLIHSACRSPTEILPEIESCSDNPKAEKAADECREALLAAWQNANAELMALMSVAQINLDTKQQADFLHSHSDMQLAITKLQFLIENTKTGADMLAEYPRIMFDNPYALPGLKGSSNCYKKSFLAISKVVEDLDEKTKQGRQALAAVDNLRGISQARDDSISSGKTQQVASSALRGIGSGESSNRGSDVTGVREDRAKSKSAGSQGSHSSGLVANRQDPSSNSKADSSITKGTDGQDRRDSFPAIAKMPGLGSRIDPSGTFSARGSLASAGRVDAGADKPNAVAQTGNSVGAALWSEAEGKMNVDVAFKGHDGVSGVAALPSASGDVDSVVGPLPGAHYQEELSQAARASLSSQPVGGGRMPASVRADALLGSMVVASAEIDIFHLVTSRYRATDLFRRARMPIVPRDSGGASQQP